jgi:hypothetical protein
LQVIDHDGHCCRGLLSLLVAHHLQQPRAHRERRGGRLGLARRRERREGASSRAEQLVDDPEVQVGLGLAGPGRQHPQAADPGQAPPHQARLPDPGIALDGHQPRLP